MRVGILYDASGQSPTKGGPDDRLCRAGIAELVQTVEQTLGQLGHEPARIGVAGDLGKLRRDLRLAKLDVVLNLCEELGDDNAAEVGVARVLERCGVPFTGSGARALGLGQDKIRAKRLLRRRGVPTPGFLAMAPGSFDSAFGLAQERPLDGVRFPLVVKPAREDGSVGIDAKAVVAEERSLRKRVEWVWDRYRQPALAEEYVEGRELCAALIFHRRLRVLPLAEVDFSRLPVRLPRIVTYGAKWKKGTAEDRGTLPVCPARVGVRLAREIRRMAKESFRALGCRDYARVDFRVSPEGEPFVLEVNPNPDLSPDAGFVRQAKAAGYTYADVISFLVQAARRRRTK